MGDVTHILAALGHCDANAADKLLPLVYDELRKLAARKMANEAAGQTRQPTARSLWTGTRPIRGGAPCSPTQSDPAAGAWDPSAGWTCREQCDG